MSESEVPFKDFLAYLYHSASTSPSSTRMNSSNSKPQPNIKSNNKSQKNPLTLQTSETTTIHGRKSRKRNNSVNVVPQDLGGLNIIIKHQVTSTPKVKKKTMTMKKNIDSSSSKQNIQQSYNENSTTNKTSSSRTIAENKPLPKKDLKDRSIIPTTDLDTLRAVQKDLEDQIIIAKPSKDTEIRPQSKSSTSENSSYPELLGDYEYQSDSIDNNIDFQYDVNHLFVQDNHHDLSFYKNFSATTRSKSSLAYILSRSITDHKHHYNHQEITFSLSKRLSRSTPIKLDLITSTPLINSDDGDDYDEEDEEENDNSLLNSYEDEECNRRKSIIGSANSNNREEESVTPTKMTRSLLVTNSQSSPTLNVMDMAVNRESLTRRINTSIPSRPAEGVVSRHKRTLSQNESSTTSTTVTVTMDTTSLFLDSVFVNLKQDVDSSATIKLFY